MGQRAHSFVLQFVVGLVALASAQALHHAGLLTAFDDHVEARRSGLAPRPATGEVVVAALDAKSLAQNKQWPWPRRLHARAIDNLVAAGAEAIFFDIDFSATSTPGDDAALAQAITRADGRVTLPVFKHMWSSDSTAENFATVSRPLPALAKDAWLAGVNVRADGDGILRTLPRSGDFAENTDVPSMAAALAEAAPDVPIRVDFSIDPDTIATVSYGDIVAGRFDPVRVRGKRVVIGATATELRDDLSVPRHGPIPGVLLHVLGAETVMQDRVLHGQPDWRTATLAVAMLLAFAVAGHNAFNIYAFVGLVIATAAGLEALAAFALIDHAMSVETGQFHVQALVAAAGVSLTNLEKVRNQLFFARRDVADGNAILGRVIDENPSGIMIVAADGTLLRANGSAATLLGARIEHSAELDAVNPDLHATIEAALRKPDETTTGTIELRPGGCILEYTVAPTQLSDDVGREARLVFCVTLNDVTQRERAHALARYQADHDGLTELYSRYAALRRLGELEADDARAGAVVIVFDLDRFGAVNEAHGFDGADRLLCRVADRLRAWGPQHFIARLGSDEFLIVAEDASVDLDTLLHGLREVLGHPIELQHASVTCSATLGVALVEPDVHDLLRRANAALRKAKQLNAPWFVHDHDLAEATRRHALIDAALPVSIAAEEFSLVFQPQLDLRSNTIKGAEALVRWTHPALGFVSPGEFIPIAEVTGQIVTLGRWVLHEACRRAAAWPSDVSIAVNVSARQMTDEILPTVEAALRESGLAPTRLEIELTEGLMVDFARIRPILAALREIGVGVAVDDFGTGYSSFSHLREAPFTKIKLDRAFVTGLGDDYRADMLFGSLTTLVADLDMDVLIEGVETDAQLALVRSTPCHAVQGYHIARPLPLAEFETFMRDWNARDALARRTA